MNGTTNVTYMIKVKDMGVYPKTLIVREFGQVGEFFSREQEDIIFQYMSDEGLGPKCVGKNDKYRVEEFIDGVHPTLDEIRSRLFRLNIALILASRFHKYQIEGVSDDSIIRKAIFGKRLLEIFNETIVEKNAHVHKMP